MTERKDIRKFGIIAGIFFGCLSGLGIWMSRPFPAIFFGILFALGLGFIIAPSPLKSVYLGWLKIAHFIGGVITVLILALAYYIVITPSAFLKRVFGGRPIPLKPDRKLPSYWVDRIEPAQPRERFLKRF